MKRELSDKSKSIVSIFVMVGVAVLLFIYLFFSTNLFKFDAEGAARISKADKGLNVEIPNFVTDNNYGEANAQENKNEVEIPSIPDINPTDMGDYDFIAYPGFSDPHNTNLNGNNVLTTSDTIIYDTGYYSVNGGAWTPYSLQGNYYTSSSDWMSNSASANLPAALGGSGTHYVLVYSCSLVNNAWDCHGNKWQLNIVEGSNNNNPNPTSEEVKVAIIGDQGLNSNAVAVLQLIKNEDADLVLHQGDFDYTENPAAWDAQINSVLGPNFPYFASPGNHDLLQWDNYQKLLEERLARIEGASCSGDYGVNSACTYKGLFFVLSGVGTIGSNHEQFLEESLSSSNALWKICSWHKNQHLMQLGAKTNEVGWEAYDICRSHGALIVTGHEHSYSRTYSMSNFESQTIYSTSNQVLIDEGVTFAVVSGVAGMSIRAQDDTLASNPWWASIYTSTQRGTYGALFCTLGINDNPTVGNCYFKNINGEIIDEFILLNAVGS